MGNTIVLGAITGVAIYITDILLAPVSSQSEMMFLFKFLIQGVVITAFVKNALIHVGKTDYLDSAVSTMGA